MDRILNDLFYSRSHSAASAELPISFLLDDKSTVVPVRLAGEQSGGKRKVSYGEARSNSERAAPSACVSRRLSAPQIVWSGVDRLDALGIAAVRGSISPELGTLTSGLGTPFARKSRFPPAHPNRTCAQPC